MYVVLYIPHCGRTDVGLATALYMKTLFPCCIIMCQNLNFAIFYVLTVGLEYFLFYVLSAKLQMSSPTRTAVAILSIHVFVIAPRYIFTSLVHIVF